MGPLHSISCLITNKFLKPPCPSIRLSSKATPPTHLPPVIGMSMRVGPLSMADQLKKKNFMEFF